MHEMRSQTVEGMSVGSRDIEVGVWEYGRVGKKLWKTQAALTPDAPGLRFC